MLELNILMIQLHLLSIQMTWMMLLLMLIIFDNMIADIMSSKDFKAIIKEIFIRCRKLNISIIFIMQSYFRRPKDARLNSTHYVIMKI